MRGMGVCVCQLSLTDEPNAGTLELARDWDLVEWLLEKSYLVATLRLVGESTKLDLQMISSTGLPLLRLKLTVSKGGE
jgi:hypothetical protein